MRFARLLKGLLRATNHGQETTANTRAPSPAPGSTAAPLFDLTAENLSELATPFPMMPFETSQSFQQLATALDSNGAEQAFDLEDLDLGLTDPLWFPPMDNFGLLVENQALDFWNSFEPKDNEWDWTSMQMGTGP